MPHNLVNNLTQYRHSIEEQFNEQSLPIRDYIAAYRQKPNNLPSANRLRYIARKKGIVTEYLLEICQDIADMNINITTRILLTQAIKYSLKNGIELEFSVLIQLLEKVNFDDSRIKSEIVYALGYKIKNIGKRVSEELIKAINPMAIEGITIQAKTFLNEQIRITKGFNEPSTAQIHYSISETTTQSYKKEPQATVTKEQQSVKITHRNNETEEQAISILGLADVLKSRSKKIKMSSEAEKLPELKKTDEGSDLGFWDGSTYSCVKKLYVMAKKGQIIKAQDIDYLHRSFIGHSNKVHASLGSGGMLTCLFIDRMIVNIFFMISKKQQLSSEIINELFCCAQDFNSVKKAICGDSSDEKLAEWATCKDIGYQYYNDEPEIIQKTTNALYKQITIEETGVLLFIGYYFPKYNPTAIIEIVNAVINEIRLDAINTVHGLVLRDKNILTAERHKKIRERQTSSDANDVEMKPIAIKISLLQGMNEVSFQILLEHIEAGNGEFINDLYEQTLVRERCEKFFSKKIIFRISKILIKDNSSKLGEKEKIKCCAIIINYLEYVTDGLDETSLENCRRILEDSAASQSFKIELLKLILLTAEKNKTLPSKVIHTIVECIKDFDSESVNFVVMTLGNIISEEIQIPNFEILATKLTDDRVIVSTGNEITFEKLSQKNSFCTSISSITCKIFVSALQGKLGITQKSIDNLVQALNSDDKQTKILAAKALYLGAKNANSIDSDTLLHLKYHVNDCVPDVAVYTTVAYVQWLHKFSQTDNPLSASHFEVFAEVYAFEDLKLGDECFTEQVNHNILTILQNEALKQQKFDPALFKIFDYNLSLGECHYGQTIKILEHYVEHHRSIPPTTVAALENALGIPKVRFSALKILKILIKNDHAVSEKTLQIFVDNLYLSNNKRLRAESRWLLNYVDNGIAQELSDSMFVLLELERAGQTIGQAGPEKRQEALADLLQYVKKGHKLSINTFNALKKNVCDEFVLSILEHVTQNNQMIPNDLLEILLIEFNPDRGQSRLVNLFFNMVKNNQNIPLLLVQKLNRALNNEQIVDEALSIFAHLIQKGEKVSSHIIQRIFERFLSINNIPVKQEYLAAIHSIIQRQRNYNFDICIAQQVLCTTLDDNNLSVIHEAIKGFNTLLSNKHVLNKISLDTLVRKATSENCNDGIKKAIYLMLKPLHALLTEEQEHELLLAENNEIPETLLATQLLEIEVLSSRVEWEVDQSRLNKLLGNLLLKKWNFEQLSILLNKCAEKRQYKAIGKTLIHVFELLDHYTISSRNYECVAQILDKEPWNWIKEINEIAVSSNFQTARREKNSTELATELQHGLKKELESLDKALANLDLGDKDKAALEQKKKDVITVLATIVGRNFPKTIEQIKAVGLHFSKWSTTEITEWAAKAKPGFSEKFESDHDFFIKTIAIIKRAIYLDAGYELTDTQIISCIVALDARKTRGRLQQIGTGEGKSTIISILAIINALKGQKVDIITSSPVLAERDAKEKSKLYAMFNLSCSDNNDKCIYTNGPKECYTKNIVYGEASQFQFDTLRDEYSFLNTLDGRKCEIALVDEVDSMLIDDGSKIARLATTSAGMDQVQLIYYCLWQRVLFIQDKVVNISGKTYLFNGDISHQQNMHGQTKIALTYVDEQGRSIQIPDLEHYVQVTKDISGIGQSIEDEGVERFLEKHLLGYIEQLMKENIIKVPNNFKEFVEKQLHKWAANAILACGYQENMHYIVQEGVIKPVDYNSTGIVRDSTTWSDGLHQFLQIKHHLKVTSETFTTNFLSNIGYFKRYGPRLYGFTGTFGSVMAQQVLSNVYNVDLISLPRLRHKQYIELPLMIAANGQCWLEEICTSATNESSKGRGTLIICETIEQSQIIAQKLREQCGSKAVKLYSMNNANQEKEIEKIVPGEIIVATNIAGRGTDIKTEDDIEAKGGMHVIITFLPSNQRVDEQNSGRTARQGKCGTGQKILNAGRLLEYGNLDHKEIITKRDEEEALQLKRFQDDELGLILKKDALFYKFCLLLKELRVKALQVDDITNTLNAIEEQWAMFLRKVEDGSLPIEQAEQEYETFRAKILEDFDKNEVIKNPYYHIAIANNLILMGKHEKAHDHFKKAIELDEHHISAAFVGKAWLLLKGPKKDADYKHQAIKEFNAALSILDDETAALSAMFMIEKQNHPRGNSQLLTQLQQKASILGSYSKSIQNAVTVIKKSLRLIELTGVKKNSLFETSAEDRIYRTSTSYCDIERKSDGTIAQSLKGFDEYELVFNDLTTYEDSGTQDQAVFTITHAVDTIDKNQNALTKLIKTNGYEGIGLTLKKLSAERLKALLNTNMTEEILNGSTILSAKFVALTGQQASDKLKYIKSTSIDLEISGSRESLIKAITDTNELEITIFNNEQGILSSETVTNDDAIKKLHAIKNEPITVKIVGLDIDRASVIVSCCENVNYNVTFTQVKPPESLYELNNEQLDISFDKLGKEKAIKLIPKLRKEGFDFNLRLKELSNATVVEAIIKGADLKQEHVEINKVKSISELMMDEAKPHMELSEFSARGIEYLLEVSEKGSIPWRSIVFVSALATLHMAVGGALILTGFGAAAGMGFITEGAADFVTAYRAYSNRRFTWSDYWQQKAVSLAIAVFTAGLQSIKETGKGAKNLVMGVGKEALKKAAINRGEMTAAQVLTQTGKNLRSLVPKLIGTKLAEAVVREGLNSTVSALAYFSMEQVKPQISKWIQDKVETKFYCESQLTLIVRKMYAIARITQSNHLSAKINKVVTEVVTHSTWHNRWDSVGRPLCDGILGDKKYRDKSFSIALRIMGTLYGMYEIISIIDAAHSELTRKLGQVKQETLTMAQLLHSHCTIDKIDAEKIVTLLLEQGILDQDENLVSEALSKKGWSLGVECNKHQGSVSKFLTQLDTEMKATDSDVLNPIIKQISVVIVEQIIRVTESQLLAPWTSYAVASFTSKCSAKIQDAFIQDAIRHELQVLEDIGEKSEEDMQKIEELKTQSRQEQLKALEVSEKTESTPGYSERLKAIHQYKTYGSCIEAQSIKHKVAYSQCKKSYDLEAKAKAEAEAKAKAEAEAEAKAKANSINQLHEKTENRKELDKLVNPIDIKALALTPFRLGFFDKKPTWNELMLEEEDSLEPETHTLSPINVLGSSTSTRETLPTKGLKPFYSHYESNFLVTKAPNGQFRLRTTDGRFSTIEQIKNRGQLNCVRISTSAVLKSYKFERQLSEYVPALSVLNLSASINSTIQMNNYHSIAVAGELRLGTIHKWEYSLPGQCSIVLENRVGLHSGYNVAFNVNKSGLSADIGFEGLFGASRTLAVHSESNFHAINVGVTCYEGYTVTCKGAIGLGAKGIYFKGKVGAALGYGAGVQCGVQIRADKLLDYCNNHGVLPKSEVGAAKIREAIAKRPEIVPVVLMILPLPISALLLLSLCADESSERHLESTPALNMEC